MWPQHQRPDHTVWPQYDHTPHTWLLGRPNPNSPLFRCLHIDILIENITDSSSLSGVAPSELHVDSLERVRHVAVSEGDVVHMAVPDWSDGKPYSTCRDSFKQHVFRIVLEIEHFPPLCVVSSSFIAGQTLTAMQSSWAQTVQSWIQTFLPVTSNPSVLKAVRSMMPWWSSLVLRALKIHREMAKVVFYFYYFLSTWSHNCGLPIHQHRGPKMSSKENSERKDFQPEDSWSLRCWRAWVGPLPWRGILHHCGISIIFVIVIVTSQV